MASNEHSGGKLERTLSMNAALAIGVGTMVGAGIFVFPGIAGGQAGPAAMISFILSGIIALLVALSTAELATAMPASGGGYYFVSRTFGPLWGTLVGISQWVGLVFASAFYLVGFAQYTIDLLKEIGFSPGSPVVLIALGMALLLTLVNLFGTRGVGRLQNTLVVILTILLSILFSYGTLSAFGLIGESQTFLTFAPNGYLSVFSTAALIFTSYLGFVQIAAVSGEIIQPQRNLPRALIGSVLIVMVLYVVAIFVSTSVLSPNKLAKFGETAMVEVARQLLGKIGAVVILTSGFLATLSSANASILSSSRAIYALSQDQFLPSFFGRVSQQFGTPYGALLIVGVPIAGFTLLGKLELLAEVASLLHLFIYGMICLALIRLHHLRPIWYVPTFRIYLPMLIAGLGAAASFGLMAFMQLQSIYISLGVLGSAILWYLIYGKGRQVPPPEPPHISPDIRAPKVLIPIAVPNPPQLPNVLVRPFHQMEILLLAYRHVPEQTNPEQSREAFSEEAKEELNKLIQQLNNDRIKVDSDLVFTPNLSKTLNRYITEYDCHAVLTLGPIDSVKRLLVPIYHKGQINKRLTTILLDLTSAYKTTIYILIIQDEKADDKEASSIGSLEIRMQRQLELSGISTQHIRTQREQANNIAGKVEEVAQDNELIVLAESKAFDRNSFFRNTHQKIVKKVSNPVLVVLHEQE